jgi:hypothetical protein
MSTENTSTQESREITVYATKGGKTTTINTNVTTWGELKPLVRNAGFDLSSLLAAENINKSDLVNDLAVLPTTPFRLFLRPTKTKSGLRDRKQMFADIKTAIEKDPSIKQKFIIDGKNMTQLSTVLLDELCTKYNIGGATASAPAKAEPVKAEPVKEVVKEAVKEVQKVVEDVKTSKMNSNVQDIDIIENAIRLVNQLSGYFHFTKSIKHLTALSAEIKGETPAAKVETVEESLAREAREMGY